MEKLEVMAAERRFLASMVNLDQAYSVVKAKGQNYPLGDKYGCDPCDACGPDACAQCKGCVGD